MAYILWPTACVKSACDVPAGYEAVNVPDVATSDASVAVVVAVVMGSPLPYAIE
jgi:hypothetical protein